MSIPQTPEAAVATLKGRLLCAVSGGADSTALLHLLAQRRPGVTLFAVHVNHGLRGEASDGDEQFVRALCASLDIPCFCRSAGLMPGASEDEAREARYRLFRDVIKSTGCDAIVLAHHMRDQAETLLEHLLRGSGLDGLCGMQPKSESEGMVILRPLLRVPPEALRSYLLDKGCTWREDASNQDPRYLRNAIRLELLPRMEALSPGAAGRMAATASLLQAEAEHLRCEAGTYLQRHGGKPWLELTPLMALDEAMQRRVLRLWWQQCTGADGTVLEFSHTQDLLSLLTERAGLRRSLPMGRIAFRGSRFLHLLDGSKISSPPSPVPAENGASLCGITLLVTPSEGSPGDGRRMQELPRSLFAGCMLRTRQQGDRITPFGARGSQSLQDYLVNRRVDAPFRDRIPLLARGSEILLVCGVGAGSIPRFDHHNDNIRLSWQGEMPWLEQV